MIQFSFSSVNVGHRKEIEMLIEKGADVNAVSKSLSTSTNAPKMTPLHYLASHDAKKTAHEHWTDDDNLSNFNLICVIFADFSLLECAEFVLVFQLICIGHFWRTCSRFRQISSIFHSI